MKQVRITRLEASANDGTFGALVNDGEMFCDTLEPYSRDNRTSVSCIPPGQYLCKRYRSQRFPDTFEVTGVAGRSYILIHAGNIDAHTEGCILLGEKVGKLRGDRAVLNSGRTFDKFMESMIDVPEFKLTIVEAF